MRVNAQPDWRPVIDRFLGHAGRDPTWQALADTATIVVHGSATIGLSDHYSDIDLQVIVPDALYNEIYTAALDAGRIQRTERLVLLRSPSTTTDGRRALCAAELRPISGLQATLDAELPVELWVMSHAWVIQDPGDRVAAILAAATQRFGDQLETLTATEFGHLGRRQRWLAIACQRRGHHASQAFLTTNLVRAAMRLACLLDDSPVPYDKWLVAWAARNTRLGAKLHDPCLELLLGHTAPADIEAVSERIVGAATAVARHRWPRSTWVTRPDHFGPVQS
jgi:hypothetical protein